MHNICICICICIYLTYLCSVSNGFQDAVLKQLVSNAEQLGTGLRWDAIASHFPDRSDVQCQQRWAKVVNPELVKGPWTKEVY